jgi:DNA-directed RNA polymerase subunit RPC12/RpoP
MTEFKPAKCPNCGGEIQIPIDREKVKCMYCGGDITVKEAIQKYHFEISGNVKLDRQEEIENYKKLGARAFEDGNYDDSLEYYTKVLEIDPDNFDAILYRGLSRAWQSTLLNNNLLDANKGAVRALEILKEKGCSDEEFYEKIDLVSAEIYDVVKAVYEIATRHYAEHKYGIDSAEEYWSHLLLCAGSLENVIELFSEEMVNKNKLYIDSKINYQKQLIKIYVELCKGKEYIDINSNVTLNANMNQQGRANLVGKYDIVVNEIQSNDPNYTPPVIARNQGGCYIATAVYNDYDAPEVIILRSFRDNILDKHYLGRLFIRCYYTISPPLAIRLKNSKYINRGMKVILDRFVEKLKSRI